MFYGSGLPAIPGRCFHQPLQLCKLFIFILPTPQAFSVFSLCLSLCLSPSANSSFTESKTNIILLPVRNFSNDSWVLFFSQDPLQLSVCLSSALCIRSLCWMTGPEWLPCFLYAVLILYCCITHYHKVEFIRTQICYLTDCVG